MRTLAIPFGAVSVVAGCARTDRSGVDDVDEIRAAVAPTEEGDLDDGKPSTCMEGSATSPTAPPSDRLETSASVAPMADAEVDDVLPAGAELDGLRLTVEDLGFGWAELSPSHEERLPRGLVPTPPGRARTPRANLDPNQQAAVDHRSLAFVDEDRWAELSCERAGRDLKAGYVGQQPFRPTCTELVGDG